MQVIDYQEYSSLSTHLENNKPVYHPLASEDVKLSENARLTLQSAASKIAEHFDIPEQNISDKLSQHYFLMEPTGDLVIIIYTADIDAEMYVEIPPGHWWIDRHTPRS